MKQIGDSHPFMKLNEIDLGHLDQYDWYRKLPDHPKHLRGRIDDRTCTCGKCDGYGNIVDNGKPRLCAASLGLPKEESDSGYSREYLQLNEQAKGWEGWPVPTFEDFKAQMEFVATDSFQAIEKLYGDSFKTNFEPQARWLCGRNGRGKTLSCLIFCSEVSKIGMKCFIFRYSELINAFKQGVDGKDKLDWFWACIRKADVVFIDEFGRQTLTGNLDHTRIALDVITNLCYRQKILLITSNLTKQELITSNSFTSNIQSRMQIGAGYSQIIEEVGDDLRGRGRLFE
jgi:DNA replication protein DnaC